MEGLIAWAVIDEDGKQTHSIPNHVTTFYSQAQTDSVSINCLL